MDLDDLSEMYPVITSRVREDPELAERARRATFERDGIFPAALIDSVAKRLQAQDLPSLIG